MSMTDTELIVAQAKQLAEQNALIDYYRKRSDELEAALRVRDNITESDDPLPLNAVGTANKMKVRGMK
jgi:hypothetical protein